jgi:TRAP transporter TAXI family solute receptor
MGKYSSQEEKSQSILHSVWEYIEPFAKYLLLAAVALAGLVLLVRFLGLQPPNVFTIATGREGGAYYAFAQQYQQRFAEEGVTLSIRPTAGSVETMQLLAAGEVDAGFVQNTVYASAVETNVTALAGVFYEALWIFYNDALQPLPIEIADLKGLRIGVGEAGSGTNSASLSVLSANDVTAENSRLFEGPSAEGAELLKEGELDALLLVAGASAPLINELAAMPGIALMPIDHPLAYTSRFKNTTTVTVGAGTFDLAQNIPAQDIQLLATTATLVAGDQLHPDLARLLLIIADEIHSDGGILEDRGEFPSLVYSGVPMNPDAVRYLENGPTGLERYLPLWIASRLERLFFLLIPAALILFPLLRGAPSLVSYFNRYRVKRRYRHLRELEHEYRDYDLNQLNKAISELESFQNDLNERVKVPTALLDEYFELRMHTGLTLDRLCTRQASLEAAGQGAG